MRGSHQEIKRARAQQDKLISCSSLCVKLRARCQLLSLPQPRSDPNGLPEWWARSHGQQDVGRGLDRPLGLLPIAVCANRLGLASVQAAEGQRGYT